MLLGEQIGLRHTALKGLRWEWIQRGDNQPDDNLTDTTTGYGGDDR